MWKFYGINIYPMARNSMGLRWSADVPGHRMMRADTKEGMRRLIRQALGK